MGIFNEHSNNNAFAKGIQGAPGVGFNLTSVVEEGCFTPVLCGEIPLTFGGKH